MKYIGIIALIVVAIGVAGYYTGVDIGFMTNQQSAPASRATFDEPGSKVTFKYPESLGEYITPVVWPPQVIAARAEFTCFDDDLYSTGVVPSIEEIRINGTKYCRHVITSGAAGSVYTQYGYSFSKGDNVVVVSISLQLVSCENYDTEQRAACVAEREAFDVDSVADTIARSLTFK